MGIKQLAKLLSEEAPECIKEVPLSSLHGRKIAIDASMAIYQFLIAVRHGNPSNPSAMLTNAEGETTSHIQGLFNRTIRFMTEGVRPVYVFDGKPPNIKSGELVKRREKREKAEKALASAKEEGNVEEQSKQSKRLVRAGQKENDDCKKLLGLMGIPVVESPCEAEAQASALCMAGHVWAVGTEDMDALTFKCPVLLRKMTFANASKSDIQQLNYAKAIEGLGLTHNEFVDLCILLGCDYCDSIKGVGPKTALKLIRAHGNIETILENIDRKKFTVPDDWVPNEVKARQKKEKDEEEYDTEDEKEGKLKKDEDEDDKEEEEEIVAIYVNARKLFNEHEVASFKPGEIKWKECQPKPLTDFLVNEMGFNPDRVQSNIEKLQKAFKATAKPQMRMDSFFKPVPGAKKPAAKRKAATGKDAAKGKKKGFFGKKR
mmetsp:Transcript_18531/g.28154  ORF Transcript_18531/g.28154 Transcript_18531/m.28154 type:complete len:431 (-) Transcript_18531:631-1923(-)|eukprot:CAMPEP_0194088446 /NCGR_PEP_ID=MMETSP0149-20130528/29156_1 /TAXON_ID=122233 /ORGANISM="Chaetoceros debilis, Strain MM31A-1" /LENGTH=430 /DNA_ID=CAMNT_0038772097 /DNA_START=59 /DNA_END=1351 /DNA_ORIENTATION=-